MKVFITFIASFFILMHALPAQSQRISGDSLMNTYYQKAKMLINEKKFSEANDYFKKIFKLRKPAPDELAYYYGITQLELQKYEEAKTALTKYLSLQGDRGPLSVAAREALQRGDCLQTGYRDSYIECDKCFGDSTIEATCRYCSGKGIELCPICKGSGVATFQTSFGTSFHTCNRCEGGKIIKCTTCKGRGKETVICQNCQGKGRKKIRKKCE